MKEFAKATRLLAQPAPGTTNKFLDPTHDKHHGRGHSDFDVRKEAAGVPTTSPYGDINRWDVLWIGHCGTHFPRREHITTPLGRAVLLNVESVPEKQHINMQLGSNGLIKQYPPHTRVTHRSHGTMCTLAYAVTQAAARALLWELGVHELSGSFDNMLRIICDGKQERHQLACFSVQPQLFQHHRPRGNRSSFSDISGAGGFNEQAFSQNIRWSTRVNFPKLVTGDVDYIDLYKDGEDTNAVMG